MANPTTSARSRSPLGDLGVSLGVLAGAALTVVGWLRAEPGTWTQADHVTWFLWFWGFTAFTTFALGLRPLAAGAALLLVVALGTGNFGALLAVLALAWSATVLGRLVLAGMREASDLEGLLVGLAVHGTLVGFLVHFPVNYAATYAALLAAPLLARQLRLCLSYPSQTKTWLGLLPFVIWRMLWAGAQWLQPVDADRVGGRPHVGPLYCEKRSFLAFERLQQAIADWQQSSAA